MLKRADAASARDNPGVDRRPVFVRLGRGDKRTEPRIGAYVLLIS